MSEEPATPPAAGKRILMLTPEPHGGMADYVAALVMALAQAGVRVVLFCPANFQHAAKVYAAGAQVVHMAPRDTSHAGFAPRLWRNLRFAADTALRLFRLTGQGTIVHLQDTFNLPLGLAFFLLPALRGSPVVFTAHDPLPHRWLFPPALRGLEFGALRLSCSLCARIIVHNQAGREALTGPLHQADERICVIPHGPYAGSGANGADYPEFDCLRLLAFGAIRENKGLHLAIQAVQTAGPGVPIPVRLTIAGSLANAAEEPYWRACQQLIATRPEVIEVIERHIADDEVGPLLARHHAVVLPYTQFFAESGVANLALSHARPILATTAGGLGDLIETGRCGIPIPAPTVAAVAEAIAAAAQAGPERLRLMGVAGGEFIRKTRSWDFVAAQTARVYSGLADRSPQAAAKKLDRVPHPYRR